MPTRPPFQIPWPLSSFPGANPQESAGRLINCHAEPLGDGAPSKAAFHRAPGLSQWAATAQTGYRGGLIVGNLSYEAWSGEAATVDVNGNVTLLGSFPGTKKISIARDQSRPIADVVAVDLDNGAYILNTTALLNASATATIGGSSFVNGDTVSLLFVNQSPNFLVQNFPVTVTYTLGAAETATTVATGLKNAINANMTLSGVFITAASAAAIITISGQGALNNFTIVSFSKTGSGNETCTFSPVSGQLAGGAGTPGINFTGAPLAYNGLGNLPQPNSVTFQDGYFFYGTADCRVFASLLNWVGTINALTFITLQAKSSVIGQRVIAYSGVLFCFTSASLEVWQDVANPAPNFPYGRLVVLEFGLIDPRAIAGFEDGFSNLFWVAQDFGVYNLPPGSLAPQKVSPPDLDRLIETQSKLGNELAASCYIFAGKKFWVLSSPAWTWELNVATGKWSERWSISSGVQGRWRGVGGHPAFGQWLMGDLLSGTLAYVDDQNFTELGAPQLFRMESGSVEDFPNRTRVARADFDFVVGVGQASRSLSVSVTGAVADGNNQIKLTVPTTQQMNANDTVLVSNVGGTTEANGTWLATIVDGTHIVLQGSVFVHAYTSGGTVTDVTTPPNVINPSVAVSWSDDGGMLWKNPLVRSLGQQGRSKRTRVSVKNTGTSGPMGRRWRLDVSDPVYTSFFGATQDSDPREK